MSTNCDAGKHLCGGLARRWAVLSTIPSVLLHHISSRQQVVLSSTIYVFHLGTHLPCSPTEIHPTEPSAPHAPTPWPTQCHLPSCGHPDQALSPSLSPRALFAVVWVGLGLMAFHCSSDKIQHYYPSSPKLTLTWLQLSALAPPWKPYP